MSENPNIEIRNPKQIRMGKIQKIHFAVGPVTALLIALIGCSKSQHQQQTSPQRPAQFFDAVQNRELEKMKSLLEEDSSLANLRVKIFTPHEHMLRDDKWAAIRKDFTEEEIRESFPEDMGVQTPLIIAANAGFAEGIELLLAHGADIHATDSFMGMSPLHWAASLNRAAAVEVLLKHGANPNAKGDQDGQTPLHAALTLRDSFPIIETLLKHGADPRISDHKGLNALHLAAFLGRTEEARVFVAAGVDVNAKTKRGQTALSLASFKGNEDVVEFLLANGADANAISDLGQTALHGARTVKIASLLIVNGANVNQQSEDGKSPLHLAAARGNAEVVELLLSHKADIHLKDNEGKTALAAANDRLNTVEKKNEDSPLIEKLKATARLLRQHGAEE